MLFVLWLTVRLLTCLLVFPNPGDGTKDLEILVLRQQLRVLRRKRGRPRFTAGVVEVDYERGRIAFDWVVVAVGLDPLWFSHLLGQRARAALADAVGSGPAGQLSLRTMLERAIGHDLAVTRLDPGLHLPVVAGVAQEPGFPDLSCLGLLADRVLGACTAPMATVGAPVTDTAAPWR